MINRKNIFENWKQFILKEASTPSQSASDDVELLMTPDQEKNYREAAKKADKSKSSSPFDPTSIATGLGVNYVAQKAFDKLKQKGAEKTAEEAAKKAAEEATKTTSQVGQQQLSRQARRQLARQAAKEATKAAPAAAPTAGTAQAPSASAKLLQNVGTKSKDFYKYLRTTPVKFGSAGTAASTAGTAGAEAGTAGAVGAAEAGAAGTAGTAGAAGTAGTAGTVGAAGAGTVAGVVLVGATIGAIAGYLINRGISSAGKGYNQILKDTLEKASQNKSFLMSELNGYKTGGYKYEAGSEDSEANVSGSKWWQAGFGLTTKGERVSEKRTPGQYDAKDGPIIIGLLSQLYNNEKEEGKIQESTVEMPPDETNPDGQKVKIADISNSSLMNYKSLSDLFGYLDETTGQYMPQPILFNKLTSELKTFAADLALIYAMANTKKMDGAGKMNESQIRNMIKEEFKRVMLKEDAAAPDPPTFKEWLNKSGNQETYNKMYEGMTAEEVAKPLENYTNDQFANDMAALNNNLTETYVKDSQLMAAYNVMINTRNLYGYSAIRKLSDNYAGARKEWWTTTEGNLSNKSSLFNEIDDIDTEASISNLGMGGSNLGAQKEILLNMIRLAYDPKVIEVENKRREYEQKSKTQAQDQAFAVGKIVRSRENNSLYKISTMEEDKLNLLDPYTGKPMGDLTKNEVDVFNSSNTFDVNDLVLHIDNRTIYKVTNKNDLRAIKLADPNDSKELGDEPYTKLLLFRKAAAAPAAPAPATVPAPAAPTAEEPAESTTPTAFTPASTSGVPDIPPGKRDSKITKVKESKNMKIRKSILNELNKLLNEAATPSSVTATGVAAAAPAAAPAGGGAAGGAPADKRKQKRKEYLLRPEVGMSATNPLKSEAEYDELLRIPKDELQEKILGDEGIEKPVYYIKDEQVFQSTPVEKTDGSGYTKGASSSARGGNIKGYSAANPFEDLEEAGGMNGNPTRKNRVVYYRNDDVLEALSYDGGGDPLQIKKGAKVKFAAKPEWGVYTVDSVAPNGTMTIVGAPAGKGKQPQRFSGEKISSYIKESKNIRGKILKELKFLLNEDPTPNSGVGATAAPAAGAAPAGGGTTTLTPEQQAQRRKMVELTNEIQKALGITAPTGRLKDVQKDIDDLRTYNESFQDEAPRGPTTVKNLTQILGWMKSNKATVDSYVARKARYARERETGVSEVPAGSSKPAAPAAPTEQKVPQVLDYAQRDYYAVEQLRKMGVSQKELGPARAAVMQKLYDTFRKTATQPISTKEVDQAIAMLKKDIPQYFPKQKVTLDTPTPAEEEAAKKAAVSTNALEESWSIKNKNKYAQNIFERLIKDISSRGKM